MISLYLEVIYMEKNYYEINELGEVRNKITKAKAPRNRLQAARMAERGSPVSLYSFEIRQTATSVSVSERKDEPQESNSSFSS